MNVIYSTITGLIKFTDSTVPNYMLCFFSQNLSILANNKMKITVEHTTLN